MSTPTLIAADCGSSRVVLARFSGDKSGSFRLEGVSVYPVESTTDDRWIRQTADAVVRGVKEFGGASKLHIVLSGAYCYGKFVKLARVEAAKLAKVIQFEAKQSIPYPLDEVSYGHVVVADDGVDLEVALAATKLDIAEPLCRLMERSGSETAVIDTSFMAEVNAARVLGVTPEEGKSAVVLTIGARTTNLAVHFSDRFFARTLNIAGSTVTQSIADELGITFEKAEELKVGLSSGEVEAVEGSAEWTAYSNAVRSFSSRLSMEVTRTLATQKVPTAQGAVTGIYLSGGGSMLQGLTEVLGERMKAPLGLLELSGAVEVGGAVNASLLEANQYRLLALVGLASRFYGSNVPGFNLLPRRVAAENSFRRQQPFIIAAAACLVGSLAFPIIGNLSRAEAFERESGRLAEQIRQFEQINREIQERRAEIERVTSNISGIEDLARSRSNWLSFFAELQERMYSVGDVWIERLQVSRPHASGAVSQQPTFQDFGDDGMFGAAPPPQQTAAQANKNGVIRLAISGRLVDRANPQSRVSQAAEDRVKRLLRSFADSDFILGVENERFDNRERGILQFDFVLAVNPQRPL